MTPRPFFSVVLPTMRVGGLDIVVDGLRGQTFRDFELVVADGLHSRRHPHLRREMGKAGGFGFPVTHAEPLSNPFPRSAFCRYANTALAHARGRYAYFVTDYTWLPPNALERHAAFHAEAKGPAMLMCPHEYHVLPGIAPRFPRYEQGEIERYVRDVESGWLDPLMWSILMEPFAGTNAAELLVDPIYGGADPKNREPAGWTGKHFFHAKNESCPMADVVAVNGWDESLDGTHGWQDSELAGRLEAQRKMKFYLDPSIVARIVNPRPVFPFARRERPYQTNEGLWRASEAAGYVSKVNDWDLAKAQAIIEHAVP